MLHSLPETRLLTLIGGAQPASIPFGVKWRRGDGSLAAFERRFLPPGDGN
jgi:hypothetical protein